MSPPTVTVVACGAMMRNVTRPSDSICGDTMAGPPRPPPPPAGAAGAWPAAGGSRGLGEMAAVAMERMPATMAVRVLHMKRVPGKDRYDSVEAIS